MIQVEIDTSYSWNEAQHSASKVLHEIQFNKGSSIKIIDVKLSHFVDNNNQEIYTTMVIYEDGEHKPWCD